MKVCSKCKIESDESNFHKNRTTVTGLAPWCKPCSTEYRRSPAARVLRKTILKNYYGSEKWRAAQKRYYSRPEIKAKMAAYERTPEAIARKKTYLARPEVKADRAAYVRERRSSDPNFRLAHYLRKRLHKALKGPRESKGSAVRDLGCTIPELKAYLESKFSPGMTWENHGRYGWHIDHIRPLAAFDLTDRAQLLEAVHYTNLQPLWAHDNHTKHAKLNSGE